MSWALNMEELSAEEMAVFYTVAKEVIPTRAFRDCKTLVKETLQAPEYTAVNMLWEAIISTGIGIPNGNNKLHIERGQAYISQFGATHGNLKADTDYIIYSFPKPPAPKLLNGTPMAGLYFVGLVYSPSSYEARCYLLRCSLPGSPYPTLLREILADGSNLNLGEGCQPTLSDFVTLLKRIESGVKHIYAVTPPSYG